MTAALKLKLPLSRDFGNAKEGLVLRSDRRWMNVQWWVIRDKFVGTVKRRIDVYGLAA